MADKERCPNPVQPPYDREVENNRFLAEEWECAMRVMDDMGVPRLPADVPDETYSIVGRIKWLKRREGGS